MKKAERELLGAQKELLNAQKELLSAQKELLGAQSILKKLGCQSAKLDEILAAGRVEPGHRGLGFIEKGQVSSPTVFVKASEVTDDSVKLSDARPRKNACYHCGKAGHIRPHCYKWLAEQRRKSACVPVQVSSCEAAAIPVRTKGEYQRQSLRKKEITCHYCEKKGHIKSKCFKFLSDLRMKQGDCAQDKGNKAVWAQKTQRKVSREDQLVVDDLVKNEVALDRIEDGPSEPRGKDLCTSMSTSSEC